MRTEEDSFYIEKTKNGDLQAFGALVLKYQTYALTLAVRILKNRQEAEEATQDAFVKAFQAIQDFEGNSKFTTWLYTIVYREAIGRIRKRKYFEEMDELEDSIAIISEDLNGFEILNRNERKEILRAGLDSLKPAESAILSLFYLDQLSIKEIEDITAQSNSQVKVLLHRGRKNLYSILQRQTNKEISPSL
ncbi:RNA polymerase sigma factor [Algoriphagus namhaensis]|uniref:RNA polymerase sigma factor n=1 Tax=Algoriphagus namhaensis TaxID=915353 RepID=A0ABV8AN90_9BACT